MEPIITIITRTFNRPLLLERALNSLLAQTEEHWIWIVVDAGDPAPVEEVIQRHHPLLAEKVLHLVIEAKATISAMTNHGLSRANTPYITLLDDDDTWHPDFLKTMVQALQEKSDERTAGVVCHSLCIEEEPDGRGGFVPTKEYLQNPRLRNISLGMMAVVNQFCVHAFVFERRALSLVGTYDESLPVLDDWEFNLRFLRYFDIMFLPKPLANYHLRPKATEGSAVNSQFGADHLHKHFEAKIINQAMRDDLENRGLGLGLLLNLSAPQRDLQHSVSTLTRRLEGMSKKIGNIDSRTKFLKDEQVKKSKK